MAPTHDIASAHAVNVAGYFSQTYAQARAKLLAAADAAGLHVESHIHPLLGRDGETLALDVVLDGPPDADALLILSSGCHGVEGFCGSGAQLALLDDPTWKQAGMAVLYLHALNPYGFSWWRRVTQENVDLNRNFLDFNQPLPANPGYDELASLLVPAQWPPSPQVDMALGQLLAERGQRALQQAVSSGQYDHPEGLFYGGRNPTWSHITLRQVLRQHGRAARRIGWIDLHSGLGPSGVGECIFAGSGSAALARARRWWGSGVTADDAGSSSASLNGQMWTALEEECPQAEYTGIALEFGTLPLMAVLQALRAEQWLENHPEADAAIHQRIKQQMRNAFYVDETDWKQRVVTQAAEAARCAMRELAPA
jgi:hypothetical protein